MLIIIIILYFQLKITKHRSLISVWDHHEWVTRMSFIYCVKFQSKIYEWTRNIFNIIIIIIQKELKNNCRGKIRTSKLISLIIGVCNRRRRRCTSSSSLCRCAWPKPYRVDAIPSVLPAFMCNMLYVIM